MRPFANKPGLAILLYHNIGSYEDRFAVTTEKLREHLCCLLEAGYEITSLRDGLDRLARRDDGKMVALTFDDAYGDFAANARAVLRDFHATATIFAPFEFLGKESSWNRFGPNRAIMNLEQLRELVAEGYAIGSHALTHPDLTRLSLAELRVELVQSLELLRPLAPDNFLSFAYPYGYFTRRERNEVANAGYDCAVIVHATSANRGSTDSFSLMRVLMRGSLSGKNLVRDLETGALYREQRRKVRPVIGRWLLDLSSPSRGA